MQALLEILGSQLLDPFRIGLIVFLVLTAIRTSQHTVLAIPVGLGVAFVAVLLPTSFPKEGASWGISVAVGLVANLIILAVVLAAYAVYRRATAAGDTR